MTIGLRLRYRAPVCKPFSQRTDVRSKWIRNDCTSLSAQVASGGRTATRQQHPLACSMPEHTGAGHTSAKIDFRGDAKLPANRSPACPFEGDLQRGPADVLPHEAERLHYKIL